MARFASTVPGSTGFALGAIAALAFGLAAPLQASEEAVAAEPAADTPKAEAKAEPQAEAKKEEPKEAKSDKKKNAGSAIPEDKVPAPSTVTKSGDPLHDYVVDFEKAYADARPLFAIHKDARHDYAACATAADRLEKTSRNVLQVHEDRLRMYGNDYHRNLQLLAVNAHRLRVAVAERNRANIFTYYSQVKLLRDTLVDSHPWK